MDVASTPIATKLNSTASGEIIFSIEDFPSSKPITSIIIDTMSPLMYSILPCPKGCPSSGRFSASLNAASVTTDEPASERLLRASAVIAIEPLMEPAISLPTVSRTLKKIPVRPHNTPYALLTEGEFVFSLSLINILERSSIIITACELFEMYYTALYAIQQV